MFWYMASHMLIMPLVDLFATACDWLVIDGAPPPGLFAFLAVSFFNGVVIEVGRKTWAPEMEREGVESYSSSWGMKRSITVWLGAIAGGFIWASFVAGAIHFWLPAMIVLGMIGCAVIVAAYGYTNSPTLKSAKMIEHISGLWVLSLYLILGLVPMSVAVWG
jgi:4-hydroxybenzoate polyprenyltransferase